jgi:hypothetical protein
MAAMAGWFAPGRVIQKDEQSSVKPIEEEKST